MTSPTGPGPQLKDLTRCRSELRARKEPFRELNRIHVITPLSAFEVLRANHFGWDSIEALQVSRLLGQVVAWEGGAVTKKDLWQLRVAVEGETEGEESGWRSESAEPLFGKHPTLPPALIEGALQRFFSWAASDGFGEIHPIEQTVLCQLRLLEICPFAKHSHVIAQVFSYLFLARSGWLLPIWSESDLDEYQEGILEALQFSTTRLVQLHVEGCLRACRRCLDG